MGGVGMPNPAKTALLALESSRRASKVVTEAIRTAAPYNSMRHSSQMNAARKQAKKEKTATDTVTLNEVKQQLDVKKSTSD
jgi:hypothetical protein